MMRGLRTNLRMQIKRMLRLLPVLLAAVAATLGILGLCAALLVQGESSGEGKHRFRIGMVGDLSDSYLGFGISMVQALDDSRFMVELVPMEEAEAKRSFRRGELSAYVQVPDGLLDSIVYGRNDKPITYVGSEGQKGIESILGEELADIASVLVTRSQSAIFGMQRVLGKYGREAEAAAVTDQMNLRLLDIVLNRAGLYTLEELGISEGLSTTEYYLGAFLVLFLLLLGIYGSPLFIRRDREMPALMKSRGIGAPVQVLGEYAAFACMNLICLFTAFLAVVIVLRGGFFEIREWSLQGTEHLRTLYGTVLPAVLMLSAMQFWLYELAAGVVGSLMLQFVCGISMAYLGGVFYPANFFPETMRNIGRILPAGAAMGYVQSGILGEPSLKAAAPVFLYFLLFLGLSVLTRDLRLERGRQG